MTTKSHSHEHQSIVGRAAEMSRIATVLKSHRNLLIEGPVGVGKTFLVQSVLQSLGKKMVRVDGDSRFTEQKLTGWFDPSLVLKEGFSEKTFMDGPLTQAMRQGLILFINELNRMPESVQNVLLPAIDEKILMIPQLGVIHAEPGFQVIATQNPREFVATSHLSEALMDRMEWLPLHYQSAEEELAITKLESHLKNDRYLKYCVGLVRLTRENAKIKRGASVRAAIAMAQILKVFETEAQKAQREITDEDFLEAARITLPTRIELSIGDMAGGFEQNMRQLIESLFEEVKKKD